MSADTVTVRVTLPLAEADRLATRLRDAVIAAQGADVDDAYTRDLEIGDQRREGDR